MPKTRSPLASPISTNAPAGPNANAEARSADELFLDLFVKASDTDTEEAQAWDAIAQMCPTITPHGAQMGLAMWSTRRSWKKAPNSVAWDTDAFEAQARALARSIQRSAVDAKDIDDLFDAASIVGYSSREVPVEWARLATAVAREGGVLHRASWQLAHYNWAPWAGSGHEGDLLDLIRAFDEALAFTAEEKTEIAEGLADDRLQNTIIGMIRDGWRANDDQRSRVLAMSLRALPSGLPAAQQAILTAEQTKKHLSAYAKAGWPLDGVALCAGWSICHGHEKTTFADWMFSKKGLSPESLSAAMARSASSMLSFEQPDFMLWCLEKGGKLPKSAWDAAVLHWDAPAIKSLLKLGADWSNPSETLARAANNGHLDAFVLLAKSRKFTAEERLVGLVALAGLPRNHRADRLSRLLALKPERGLSPEELSRALVPAVLNEQPGVVENLLKWGALPTGPDGQGLPLKEALKTDAVLSAKLLAQANGWGPAALEFALRPRARPSKLLQKLRPLALAVHEERQLQKVVASAKKTAKSQKTALSAQSPVADMPSSALDAPRRKAPRL